MTPKEILQKWIDCFNAADAVALANLYAQDAINHQVANTAQFKSSVFLWVKYLTILM